MLIITSGLEVTGSVPPHLQKYPFTPAAFAEIMSMSKSPNETTSSGISLIICNAFKNSVKVDVLNSINLNSLLCYGAA
ncbi:hypothetical protein [Kaistella antarctica]|uniref:hypothetical protein n=1 Tax=Kaistella antarctica TaxID=266748 RepID=UPI00116003A9|nr:hypothetical protein [Kaistella antarctica]